MTRSEFNALSKRARLRATLSRDAAYMVLVGGVRPGIAAREVGTTPQALTNTLRKLRDAMKESTAHGRTHATADHHVGS
ncbi:hypothetical protein J2W32_000369 [Variovorax boronicumulans]|jgi:hypothetical protein|uniref:TrfB transcriptional repressor protein domain-containing protein n=1 Tax=Variovorax boronicumulans TaxID=436515 RepID=A0AAW8CQN9_9BURK|nr:MULTISPECIES: hypothetical protein [Variovorax]MDP9891272.1 hypothetical protein [Variovorax boronicumulans]MDP9992037.1 hypothetical protein [Variovorax boronicumulans]MDQ0001932.1 hypothetical protein [Variovorax boronicumulans]MDQ0040361.1 hypothetical protein [Variovorax boronicumulans]MDQ0051340.1 hypothetical protein [Variovorax boronicumulans]